MFKTSLSTRNYLFREGQQSGFHLKGTYSNMRFPFNEYNMEIGYTLNGRLSLDLNNIKWKSTYNDIDTKVYFTGGGLNYLLVKQDKFPVYVSFGASYMYS